MKRNNLDIAMLITDAILNQFESNGKVIREFSSEVLVEVEDIAKDNRRYFKKLEVEIVDE